MIRLSSPVASGPSVLVYEDAADPGVLYYLPRFAEPCRDDDGEVKFEQRMFRTTAGAEISAYNLAVRGVAPAEELAALVAGAAEARRRPVSLTAAPVWVNSAVGVTLLTAGPWRALGVRARSLAPDFAEVFVMLAVGGEGEPALAERFRGPEGVRLELEFRATGAAPAFHGRLRARFGEVRRRLHAALPHGAASWDEVAARVEAMLADGTLSLELAGADGGEVPPAARVSAAARRVIDRLMRLDRHPARETPFPSMHGAWFRLRDGAEDGGWETVEVRETGLETRPLAVTARIASVPADAFCGLDGVCEPVTPGLARGFARQGVPIG